MNCMNKTELEQYLQGKLETERLLAVDAHLSTCTSCKMALQGLPAQQKAGTALGANLLGLHDCPEYDALSAYVDSSLDVPASRAIAVHANFCEECARDIARIQELRSHASMREQIEVFPGMSRQSARRVWGYWKQAVALLSGAAVVVAVALSVGQIGSKPGASDQAASNNRPTSSQAQKQIVPKDHVADNSGGNPPVQPGNTSAKPGIGIKPDPDSSSTNPALPERIHSAREQYATVLKDGDYRVIKGNGNYEMATADGTPIRTRLEARIAASVREKLRTGKIKQAESYQTASAEFGVRGIVSMSPSAPKIESPADRVILTDKPTLTWSKSEMAESYIVTIYDTAGNPVLDQVTKNNALTLSEPLTRGKTYLWRVGVRFGEGDDWTKSKSATFAVLSAEDMASVQKIKAQGSHLALGAAYEYFGLFDEARAEYHALLKENPESELADKLTVK